MNELDKFRDRPEQEDDINAEYYGRYTGTARECFRVSELPAKVVGERRNKHGKSSNKNAVRLYFDNILSVTQINYKDKGAIRVSFLPDEEGVTPDPEWLPKKLCCNLEYDEAKVGTGQNTIEIWNVFMEENKAQLESYWEVVEVGGK